MEKKTIKKGGGNTPLILNMESQKSQKIKCKHCQYEWVTASERMFVTCPNCIKKTEKEK